MPSLPADLNDTCVNQISPHMTTVQDRLDALIFLEQDNVSVYNQIIWEGTRSDFTRRLVEVLPSENLLQLLGQLRKQVAPEQQQQIDEVCKELQKKPTASDAAAVQSKADPSPSKWSFFWTLIGGMVVTILYLAFIYRNWTTPQELFALLPSFLLLGFSIGLIVSAIPIRHQYWATFLMTAPAPILAFIFESLIASYTTIVYASVTPDPVPPERDASIFRAIVDALTNRQIDVDVIAVFAFLIVSGLGLGLVACLGTKIGFWLQDRLLNLSSTSKHHKLWTVAAGFSSAAASIIVALIERI